MPIDSSFTGSRHEPTYYPHTLHLETSGVKFGLAQKPIPSRIPAAMPKKKPAKIGRPPKSPDKRKTKRYHLQLEPGRFARYQRAADAADVDLAEWMRRGLDEICRQQGIE